MYNGKVPKYEYLSRKKGIFKLLPYFYYIIYYFYENDCKSKSL